MGAALAIRDDVTPEALRRLARREPNRRAALRMLAIANALEGLSRAEAARLAGMERQALRDAVVRYNAEGGSPGCMTGHARSGRLGRQAGTAGAAERG
jgi:hypothetical protein